MSKSKHCLTIVFLCVFLANIMLPSIFIAQAQENTWTTLAPMPTPRASLGLVVLDNKIYAIGGSKNGEYLGTNEMYNPETNTWTSKTLMPTPRSGFVIAVIQNKIHVIGGSTGDTLSTSIHEVYDPINDSWTTKEQAPLGHRAGITANVVDNKIYIISGCTSPYRSWINTSKNDIYDPITDTWTYGAPIPTRVFAYGSTTLDDKIYLFGGRSIPDNKTYSLTQIYDTKNNTWSKGAAVPIALSGSKVTATIGIQAPKRIYLFNGYKCEGDGGYSYSEDVYITFVYDPKADTWDNESEVLNRRSKVATINDIIYAIDGFDGEKYTSFSAKYIPVGYGDPDYQTPSPKPEFPTTIVLLLIVVVASILGISAYFKKRRS